MYVRQNRVAALGNQGALLVYLHPQRTGGTRLKQVLYKLFGRSRVYTPQVVGREQFKNWETVSGDDLRGFAAFAGHADYVPKQLPFELVIIGTVRHPYYRMLSYYEYCKTKENQRFQRLALDNDFVSFLRKGAELSPKYFHNLQCRRFCRKPDARAAIETVARDFALMAPMERLTELADLLAAAVAAEATVSVEGIRSEEERYGPADSTTEDFEAVMANNEEDMKLYEWVRSHSD